MKRAFSNLVETAFRTVKMKINHLIAEKSDVEMVVENTEVSRSTTVEREKKQLESTDEAQPDKQGPCLELVQFDHPSTSSGNGRIVTSNVVLFSCEELETLEMKMENLFARKSDVETTIEHAEIQPGKKRKREVELWLSRVEQMKTELENIKAELEEYGPCKNLKNHIVSMTREAEELTQQGKFPTGVVLDHQPVLEMVETSLVGSRSAENIEMILDWLKEDGVSAIGVHGMGGVGKTTLLKIIHNRLLLVSIFNKQVYWVTASRDCSLQKLQAAIGKCLGLGNIAEEDAERRKSLIFNRLCQLKKSVLIIDDMWNYYSTDKIGIPLGSCKIVITTRSLEVCQKVRCQKAIKVVPLSREDAWSLFVTKSGEVPDNVTVIAAEIVKQCAGLPLALITMGSCMRGVNTDVQQWENALYELKKPARRQDHDMDDDVFQILQFSYDSLKEERMKQCFLSCVLFPEDFVIRQGDLIDLWITEGLLDDIEGWENKVNKGHTISKRLESSSLLESTSDYLQERYVRMHDLIRDMALILSQNGTQYMAKAGIELNKVLEYKEWTLDLVKVSLSRNEIKEIPCGMSPETPKLRVLLLSRNPLNKIPESFFVHMKALQVLDLGWTEIERLPDTFSDLENLRGLFLHRCLRLKYVPSVAKLAKLMALDLNLTKCLEGLEGLERLTCLEKLFYHSPWSHMPSFNNLMLSCQLKSYTISLGSCILKTVYGRRGHSYKKEVRIIGVGEIAPVLPSTIQSLVIQDSSIQRSLVEVVPSLRHATDLRNLELRRCEMLEYLFISSDSCEDGSSYLHQSLELDNLFSNLKSLDISWCPKIRYVFPVQQHISLPYLESIRVQGCDTVEEIIAPNKESSSLQTSGHIMNATFPKLRHLRLQNLPKLGNIDSMELHLCTSLVEITIEDCPKIDRVRLCASLVEITITDCMNLESICEETQEICEGNSVDLTKHNPIVPLPNLRLLQLTRLPKLGSTSIYPLQLHLSTSLEGISIIECPKVEGIFANPTGVFKPVLALPELNHLILEGLPNMSSIYKGLLVCPPAMFEYVTIKECPQLQTLSLSAGLICDASPSTVASFPTESEDPEWWKPLHREFSDDVLPLSGYIQQARRGSPLPQREFQRPLTDIF